MLAFFYGMSSRCRVVPSREMVMRHHRNSNHQFGDGVGVGGIGHIRVRKADYFVVMVAVINRAAKAG